MTLRDGLLSDLNEIRRLNEQAVRAGSSAFYPKEIIDQWTGNFLDWYYPEIFLDHHSKHTVKVVEQDDRLVGVGMAFPDELYFLFVDPDYFGRGIGSEILADLERVARNKFGTETFKLLSVLNAVPFYQSRGYRIVGDEGIDIGNGLEIEARKMEKVFD